MSLLTGINILVADDNPLNQKIVSLILKRYGCTLEFAFNGREVINKIAEKQYDIILMDVQMPEMDGFETTRYIRKVLHNQIPVIALTADSFLDEAVAFNEVGMNGYISKPFEPEQLCNLILKLVNKTSVINE